MLVHKSGGVSCEGKSICAWLELVGYGWRVLEVWEVWEVGTDRTEDAGEGGVKRKGAKDERKSMSSHVFYSVMYFGHESYITVLE